MMPSLAGTERPGHDTADLPPSVAARHACRTDLKASTTAGVANGFVPGQSRDPESRSTFTASAAQSKTVPIIGMSDVGDPAFPRSASISNPPPICRATASGATAKWSRSRPTSWRTGATDFVALRHRLSVLLRGSAARGRLPRSTTSSATLVPMLRRISRQVSWPVCRADGVDAAVARTRRMRSARCRSPRAFLPSRCAGSSRPSALRSKSRHQQARLSRESGTGGGGQLPYRPAA